MALLESSSWSLAPRLRTRLEPNRPLILAGLIALALLALGEAAPGAFPVSVRIEAHGDLLDVSVDGQTHTLASTIGGNWQGILLDQPGPLNREYQVDGSDTTSTSDRQRPLILKLLDSPLYCFDAWLRDESSYSRWEHARVLDLATGRVVPGSGGLPADFRIEADLRRPEAPARLWLVGADGEKREGLELDRDRRNARWLTVIGGVASPLPRWFFPEQPAPFAAELLQLLGRSAATAYALALAALALGRLTSGPLERLTNQRGRPGEWLGRAVVVVTLGTWLAAAGYVTVALYHQLPHILDAVSYTYQAGLLATGQLAAPAPPIPDAFRGPFQVMWDGRIFSQYPPGAPAIYALGRIVGLEWLVGPLACFALIGFTAWTARALFGNACGLLVLILGALSPFVLFQAGAYMSHPVAGGVLAGALAAFVAAERGRKPYLYAITGALLGVAFVAREVASVLFAIPLALWLISRRSWESLALVCIFGMPFVVGYLVYNLRETGSPFLLPRMIFDAADHFGFGDGVGFHTRHTLAAGFANTDELLTLLQFDLFGWPPLFAFGVLLLPFLLGPRESWDLLAATGFLAFVVAYVAYFYHGNALGPRYYFEALPWLLLLAARGFQLLGALARTWAAPALILGALSLNTVLFYTPAELQRRADLSGMPGSGKLSLAFVDASPFGPRLDGVDPGSLVLTDDWWLYNAALAALNCPTLPNCGVLFALATSPADATRLHDEFPDRTLLRAVNNAGRVELMPYRNS